MSKEPTAMKEVHDLRLAIHEKRKGLTLHEKIKRMKKRADEEWKAIWDQDIPGMVAEKNGEYEAKDREGNHQI